MKRLIDADALKEYIDCGHLRDPGELCFSEIDVVELIDAQPTIDAVPVIRCKDCKYGERWAPDKCYCNGFLNAWVDEDDFCAWAERKETEQ